MSFARDVDEAGWIFDPEICPVSIFDRHRDLGSGAHAQDRGIVDGDWCGQGGGITSNFAGGACSVRWSW